MQLLKVCYNQRKEKVTSAFLRVQIDYESNDVCLSLSVHEYVFNLIEKCDNTYFCFCVVNQNLSPQTSSYLLLALSFSNLGLKFS